MRFDEENNANTAEEARESRLATDAREEDAHEEESAEATGEEPKDFLGKRMTKKAKNSRFGLLF